MTGHRISRLLIVSAVAVSSLNLWFTIAVHESSLVVTKPTGATVLSIVRRSPCPLAMYPTVPTTNISDRKLEEMYTIRMNTWNRPKELHQAIEKYTLCPGVAQIQVVWSQDEDPPEWLSNHDKVVIERHNETTLNERFRIIQEPPTEALLSMDDDISIPCLALDAGYFLWRENPTHMVGFDGRSYENGKYQSRPRNDHFSISLTRLAFLHRQYWDSYWNEMTPSIRERVTQLRNCEDLAMSLWITSHTRQAPLLAPFWALKSQKSIRRKTKGISSNIETHGVSRSACVQEFSRFLHVPLVQRPMPLPLESNLLCGGGTSDHKTARQAVWEKIACDTANSSNSSVFAVWQQAAYRIDKDLLLESKRAEIDEKWEQEILRRASGSA